MSKLETNTIDTVSGSTSLQIGSTNTSTITLGASGDSIVIPSGATITNNGTQSGFGGVNTPAFMAYLSSTQTISDNTFTKIQFDTEVLDTDNCYDNSTNYRFTPTTAGKYFISCYTAGLGGGGNTDILRHYQALYKNGSQAQLQNLDTRDGGGFRILSLNSSYIINMNGTTDYLEIFASFDSNSGSTINVTAGSTEHSFFSAYKIIE